MYRMADMRPAHRQGVGVNLLGLIDDLYVYGTA